MHIKMAFALWMCDEHKQAIQTMQQARALKTQLGLDAANEAEVVARWQQEISGYFAP